MKPTITLILATLSLPLLAQKPAPSDVELLLQHAILPADLPARESLLFCDPKCRACRR